MKHCTRFFGQECVVSPHPTALTGHCVAFIVWVNGAILGVKQGNVYRSSVCDVVFIKVLGPC